MMNNTFSRATKNQVARAAALAASILADVAGRRGALDGRIRPLSPGMRLCGPAFTVEVRPGDNLMVHAALVLAQPGDVLVIDGKSDLSCALMGELMCTHARATGIAGVVIDGAVRDVAELRNGPLPVFAGGASPNGPTKRLGGRIGYPVSMGNVAIMPGDLVAGDDDGVVIIPREQVEQVLQDAGKKVEAERKRLRDIAEGRLIYGWLEEALRDAGALPPDKSLQDAMGEFGSSL